MQPEPDEQHELQQHAEREEHELPVELDPATGEVVDHEADQHRQRQHVLDALGDDAPDDPDLAREVRRADQPGLLDQALGRVVDRGGEPLPGEQPGEQVEEVRLVGDPAGLEDEGEDDEVDRRHEQRVEDGPHVAQHAAGVPHAQVAPDQRPHDLAPAGDRSDPGDQRGDLDSAWARDDGRPSGRRGEDTAHPSPARRGGIRCRARGAARHRRRAACRRRPGSRAAWRTRPGRRGRSGRAG